MIFIDGIPMTSKQFQVTSKKMNHSCHKFLGGKWLSKQVQKNFAFKFFKTYYPVVCAIHIVLNFYRLKIHQPIPD